MATTAAPVRHQQRGNAPKLAQFKKAGGPGGYGSGSASCQTASGAGCGSEHRNTVRSSTGTVEWW